MLLATVVAEVLFWACLVLGCVFRYTLKLPKVGIVFLVATPIIDLFLLVISYITLHRSEQAEFMHGFAAFYIAFSVVFGRDIIRAFDKKFAPDAGSRPLSTAKNGFSQFQKCLIACVVTALILIGGIFVAGLNGSFWLVYWLIGVAFTPLMWLGVQKFTARG